MPTKPPSEPKPFKLKAGDGSPTNVDHQKTRIAGWGYKIRPSEPPFPKSVEVQVSSESETWLSALNAVNLLSEQTFKDEKVAKRSILSRLKDGVLEGAADAFLGRVPVGGVARR